MKSLIATILFSSIATAAAAQTPGFWLVGMPAGSQSGGVSGLSQDGTVAVGSNFNPGADRVVGFRWSVAQGRHDFGNEPGMPAWTGVSGCSNDGSVVVGRMYEAFVHPSSAYRLVGNGLPQSLGTGGASASEAFGVSGDGSTVVGWTHGNNGFGQAFRWTQGGGLQGLGFLRPNGTRSQAEAISRDGSTIVGYGQAGGPFNTYEAFRWTDSGGMEHLAAVPGSLYPDTYAHAASADGSIVVGLGHAGPNGNSRAVLWELGGAESLGTLTGNLRSAAYAISDDGAVVGGSAYDGVSGTRAFVWTREIGMSSLTEYLLSHGIQIPSGFRPENVRAISGDGLTFAGYGLNLTTNLREGFVATIPAPASAMILLLAPALSLRQRRTLGS